MARWALALARRAIARPRRAIGVSLTVVLLAALGLTRLELRTDGHALVPADHPTVLFDAEVRERYGLSDPIVVLFETDHPDGIYNPATLAAVQRASNAVAALDGLGEHAVTSLATESRDRVYPGTLEFRPFLDPPPTTPELLATVRGDVEATGIAVGTLVSADRTATALMVGAPSSRGGDGGDRRRLLRQIREAVEPEAAAGDRLWIAGAPVAESLLGDHILADLALLVPLSMTVIALVLWLGCRRLWGVLLALGEIGACLLFTFGLMGWTGSPVYLTTAVLPVILVSLGLADEIHVFWHYQRRLAAKADDEESRTQAVAATMTEMVAPITLTSITTGVAFLSFLASSIAPVRSFGLFAAIGIAFCWGWTMTVIPASLALLSRSRFRRPVRGDASRYDASAPAEDPHLGPWLGRWLGPSLARPRGTLAVFAGLTLVAGVGLARLYVQDSWLDGFAAGSPLRRATAAVNEKLHGSHVLLLELAFDPAAGASTAEVRDREGPFLVPENLELIGRLESFVRDRPEVGGVLGPHAQVSATSFLWLGRKEENRRIPDAPNRLERALDRFRMGRGEHRLREVIDPTLHRGVVTVFLEDANYRDTRRLMAAISGWSAEHLEPRGGTLRFAGDVAVSQVMIPAIVRTQATSVALALLGTLLVVSWLYRSLAAGLLVALPTAVAVIWVAGVMGWLGMPLGVATSMFCAITLGIGVDYSIHLYERHRQTGTTPAAVRIAGPAIVADAAAIALGFGLLTLSRVPANAKLGLLVATALIAAAVLTLGGLGAVLALRDRRAA